MKNDYADLIDMRFHPFLIKSRERLDKMRHNWSRKNYSEILIDVEALEAACSNFASELEAAIKADHEDKERNPFETPDSL